METESLLDTAKEKIREEKAKEVSKDITCLVDEVFSGNGDRTRGNLFFLTAPEGFKAKAEDILEEIQTREHTENSLRFLIDWAVDLKSFLPEWNLLRECSSKNVDAVFDQIIDVLRSAEDANMDTVRSVEDTLYNEAKARFTAEDLGDKAEEEAKNLLSNTLEDYVGNAIREVDHSNIREAAGYFKNGKCLTEIGNDYAAFLDHVLRLGGTFVTTNPVLIKLAWDIDPERWNEKVDRIILSRFDREEMIELLSAPKKKRQDALSEVCSLITMAVVEENCRKLRSLFLSTEGERGYVSLQVNPRNHFDAVGMIDEARMLWKELWNVLSGVPNVVFKLPGTFAGKKAAEKLIAEGIGVNITLDFSVFQTLDFAEILKNGKALVTYISLMNGRLAFPVRDEMLEKGIEKGLGASRYAGVTIAREAFRKMYGPENEGGMGIDPGKVRFLIASLRDYDGWIPDVSELWGVPVITFFPNIRRRYDSVKRDFNPESIGKETPESEVKTLFQSEIFRQAYFKGNGWVKNKPKKTVSLDKRDDEVLVSWTPIKNTLDQFIQNYGEMSEMVKNRIQEIINT